MAAAEDAAAAAAAALAASAADAGSCDVEARLPPLAEVKEQVEADWNAMQIQTAVKALAADLRQRRADEIRLSPDAANRLALLANGDFDVE